MYIQDFAEQCFKFGVCEMTSVWIKGFQPALPGPNVVFRYVNSCNVSFLLAIIKIVTS